MAPLLCSTLVRCDLVTSETICEARVTQACLSGDSNGYPVSYQVLNTTVAPQCITGLSGTPACDPDLLIRIFQGCISPLMPSVAEGSACGYDSDCLRRPDGGYVGCVGTNNQGSSVSCGGVCKGGLVVGSECVGEIGCDNSFCNGVIEPDGGYQQLCQAYTALGAPCDLGNECGPTAYCSGGSGVCALRVHTGDTCEYDGACPDGDYCASSSSGTVCMHYLSVGGNCGTNALACNPSNAACDNGTCQPSSAAVGEPCVPGVTSCRNDGHIDVECVATSGQTTGTCTVTAQPHLGDACTGDNCGELFPCVNNVCVGLPLAGQTCTASTNNSCQLDTECNNATTTCQALVAVGASCTSSGQCLDEDYCDATGHCAAALHLGDTCNPSLLSCPGARSHEDCTSTPDGGFICLPPSTDPFCLQVNGAGPTVCQTYCHGD